MTWLNHAATGALVAVVIKKPALAIPIALLSHFVADVIPHWDFKYKGGLKQMQAGRLLDLNLALVFLIIVMLAHDTSAGLILACGLLAILPDAIFTPYFLTGKNTEYSNDALVLVRDFSLNIQKSETRRGIFVELVWFILVAILIFAI